jgi:hypothetical protein
MGAPPHPAIDVQYRPLNDCHVQSASKFPSPGVGKFAVLS